MSPPSFHVDQAQVRHPPYSRHTCLHPSLCPLYTCAESCLCTQLTKAVAALFQVIAAQPASASLVGGEQRIELHISLKTVPQPNKTSFRVYGM